MFFIIRLFLNYEIEKRIPKSFYKLPVEKGEEGDEESEKEHHKMDYDAQEHQYSQILPSGTGYENCMSFQNKRATFGLFQ